MTSPERPLDAQVLAALDADRWAEVLRSLRAVLRRIDDLDAELAGFLGDPPSRLAGGRGRAAVAARLADDAALWRAVVVEAAAAGVVLAEAGESIGVGQDGSPVPGHGTPDRASDPPAALVRLRDRARELRRDRDAWRRRAEGAATRAEALAREVAQRDADRQALEAELRALREDLAEAGDERDRAVQRERRRAAADRARLADELAGARRALEEERARAHRPRPPAAQPARTETSPGPGTRDGFRSGRPSRLPADVPAGTTEAAALLLPPGRLVLVDGYNVSKQHQPALDLELQRRWLLDLLVGLAARRRVRPVVVFDGRRAGGRRGPAHRAVEVRFTGAGTSADDELVFAVDATDEPVTVVTDDRELRDRLRRLGADLLDTVSFVGAARGGA